MKYWQKPEVKARRAAYKKAWRLANLNRQRLHEQWYRQSHREQINESIRRYRQTEKGKAVVKLDNQKRSLRRKAQKLKLTPDIE